MPWSSVIRSQHPVSAEKPPHISRGNAASSHLIDSVLGLSQYQHLTGWLYKSRAIVSAHPWTMEAASRASKLWQTQHKLKRVGFSALRSTSSAVSVCRRPAIFSLKKLGNAWDVALWAVLFVCTSAPYSCRMLLLCVLNLEAPDVAPALVGAPCLKLS